MTMPLVSVVIPAFNAGSWIGQTLDSVLLQTWQRKEVIVVDDGSRDDTLEVARSYAKDGVRVFVQAANQGQPAALNRGLAHAGGDFIQYLDADDILEASKIEEQMRRLLVEPPGTIASAAWARFYDDDLCTARFVESPDWRDYDEPLEWLVDDWNGRGTMPPGAWLYPRAVVLQAGPWHEGLTLNNDMEYFTRVVLASRKIVFCRDARLYYRTGHGGLSSRRGERAMRSQYEVIRLSTERLLEAEDSTRTRRACAGYWQSFLFTAYPDFPEFVRLAERRIAELGGGERVPEGGRMFRIVRDTVGWKPAVRLQRICNRWRLRGSWKPVDGVTTR